MKNKINVAELLKDCPKGMELDCALFNNPVTLEEVTIDFRYPIVIKLKSDELMTLTEHGCYSYVEDAKCVIFPKGKTTWEGFQRPFKDGDIVYTRCGDGDGYIFIFENVTNNTCVNSYLHLKGDDLRIMKVWLTNCDDKYLRLATEEEKAKLFKAIKDNGYKWNSETKTLNKLVEPKFKVGDKIKMKVGTSTIEFKSEKFNIIEIKSDSYIVEEVSGEFSVLPFVAQDYWELVPNKFDISTLKPFESKVLVRNDNKQRWIPAFWGGRREDGYTTTFGWSKYCVPFDGNENLLGTNNDCDEYYKN